VKISSSSWHHIQVLGVFVFISAISLFFIGWILQIIGCTELPSYVIGCKQNELLQYSIIGKLGIVLLKWAFVGIFLALIPFGLGYFMSSDSFT